MSELKQLVEDLGKTVSDFRKKNDELEKQLKEKGSADILLKEEVDSLNAKITDLEELKTRLDTIEAKGNRPGGVSEKEEAVSEHKQAFSKYLKKGHDGELADLQMKAMQIGVDADGGYAVPEELDRSVLELLKELSPIRGIVNTISVSTENYEKLVNIGGVTSGWVGETAARPETNTPQLTKIAASMGEIYANPAVTQHALEDPMFNAESFVKENVATEFALKEAAAFLNGDGTNKPKGLLTYPTAATADGVRAFGTFEEMASSASGDITSADVLIDLVYKIKAGFRSNSRFLMNKLTLAKLRKFKDTTGQYLWQPSLQAGQPSTLVGYAVTEVEDMPDVAAGALAIAFGDFQRAYTICDRIGTSILRDPYTNKPYVHFYTRKRVGGMAVDSEAVKFIKIDA